MQALSLCYNASFFRLSLPKAELPPPTPLEISLVAGQEEPEREASL